MAEGIETPTQLARLRELGCELGQGYLFAQPLERDATADLVARRIGPVFAHEVAMAARKGAIRTKASTDHREPALPEVGDLVEDERELLERRDDDPALLARERLGELGAVLVDPGHEPVACSNW